MSTEEKLAEVEWRYVYRTNIDEMNKNAKHGTAMPPAFGVPRRQQREDVGRAAGVRDLSLGQEVAGIDQGNGHGRRTIKTLRREPFTMPGRATRGAGPTYLRLQPGLILQELSFPTEAGDHRPRPHEKEHPKGKQTLHSAGAKT